jgi:PEP-CTERM motif
MKHALLCLAGVALAVPAFASSIAFYSVQTGGRYAGDGAPMAMGKQSTKDPAAGMFDAGNALLPKGGAFAFHGTRWTDFFANDSLGYTGSGLLFGWNEATLSGVHTQRLNLVGGKTGHLYNKGHVLNRESLRTTVPEPETLGLLGTGLFVIGGLVRRKLRVDHLVSSSHIYRPDGGLDARERNFRTGTLTRWYGAEKGITL